MIKHFNHFDKINFNGGNLSSDGGAILLLSYLDKHNLLDFTNQLPFSDERKNPTFSNSAILNQLIQRCLLGYFNQSDQSYFLEDPLLSRYVVACSQPTVSRFFDRVSYPTNMALKQQLQKTACHYVNQHIDTPILDVDSTKTETSGKQEGAAHIFHYNIKGYHPMVINEYHSSLLLSANLRTGSAYSSNGFIEEMKEVLVHLKTEKKTTKLRADSAFYNVDYLEFMEENAITYYVRSKRFQKVHNEIMNQLIDDGIDFENYTTKDYYGSIDYKMSGSETVRRMVYKVKAEVDKQQLTLIPTIYCVITNDKESTPEEVMTFYEGRGNSENFTKELKDDFDGGRVSHQEFLKNEIEFLISGLSYNLYQMFKESILEGEDKKIRMKTFRINYQKIAIKVVKHAKQITLSFSSVYKRKDKFLYYLKKILV